MIGRPPRSSVSVSLTTDVCRHPIPSSAGRRGRSERRRAVPGRGVAVEDRQPPPAIRDRDGDVGIEAPRPKDGRVNGRQPVGRRQHDDLPPRVEAVEQHEELGDQLRVMGLTCPSRRLASASSSSMRMTAGWCARARAKTCRRCASPPPTHWERISGPLTVSRCAAVSVATACASNVLPLPGGP